MFCWQYEIRIKTKDIIIYFKEQVGHNCGEIIVCDIVLQHQQPVYQIAIGFFFRLKIYGMLWS